ncbi:MAG: putative DNA binding domain-containing protein, partial [bacterium]|nr:putative DNA binding domain-containing protein [bacterium]
LLSNLRIRDLSDPLRAAPRSLERHHLFPKAHLAAKGITRLQETNAIANMAFLDWPDNAAVGPEDPRAYWPAMSAAMDPARLERQMYWHALPVGWEQLDYPTFLARRRRLLAMVVRDGVEQLWDAESSAPPAGGVDELLKLGESQTLEFKSSARWNSHTGRVDKRLEHVVVKTVCGLLNAEGGKLLIGVNDDAEVLGVDVDMETLGRKADKDGYELFLRQLLENSLSVPTAGIVHIGFEHIGGVEICVVTVASSGKPVFAKPLEGGAGHIEFWLRVGNATRQLHGDDMLDYKNSHWGD